MTSSPDRRAQYVLTNRTTNLAVAANPDAAVISDGDFVVDVWGTFNGCTVNVYIFADDGTPILLEAYTAATSKFGQIGQVPRRFSAEVVSAGASTNVSCTISN